MAMSACMLVIAKKNSKYPSLRIKISPSQISLKLVPRFRRKNVTDGITFTELYLKIYINRDSNGNVSVHSYSPNLNRISPPVALGNAHETTKNYDKLHEQFIAFNRIISERSQL